MTKFDFFSKFQEAKKDFISCSKKENKDIIEIYADFVNELVKIIMLLFHFYNRSQNDDSVEVETYKLCILSSISQTSLSIYDLTLSGAYREGRGLFRTMLEDYETMLFLHHYPDRVTDWMAGDISQKDILKAIDKKLRDLGIKSLKKQLWQPYSHFSEFIHSSVGALSGYAFVDGVEIGLKLGQNYNHEWCENNLIDLCFMLGALIKIVLKVFKQELLEVGYSSFELSEIQDRLDRYVVVRGIINPSDSYG